jgi:small GTP-binding protein
MYDTSDGSSMDGVAHWHQQVCCLAGQGCIFVVVGCKADRNTADGVTKRARAFAESIRAEHIQTSALNGINTTRVFESLARGICFKAAGGMVAAPRASLPEKTMPSFYVPETSCSSTSTAVPTKTDSGSSCGTDLSGPPKSVKLVLLGDPDVGKSSLAARLGNTRTLTFQEDYVPTAGPEFLTRQLVVNQSNVKLQVWEAGGQDLMQDATIRASVCQGADAALILYDITSKATFDNVNVWMQLLVGQVKPMIPVMLVGNKADRVGRSVAADLGLKCSEALRIPFVEHSAKFGGADSAVSLLSTLLAACPPDWSAAGGGGEQLSSAPVAPVAPVPVATSSGRAPLPLGTGSGAPSALKTALMERLRAGRGGGEASDGQLTPRMTPRDLRPDDDHRVAPLSLNQQLSNAEPRASRFSRPSAEEPPSLAAVGPTVYGGSNPPTFQGRSLEARETPEVSPRAPPPSSSQYSGGAPAPVATTRFPLNLNLNRRAVEASS